MMGKHQFAPKLYYELSLDRLVPQDHLLRQIAAAIDFAFVYSIAQPYYSHTGQPHPWIRLSSLRPFSSATFTV